MKNLMVVVLVAVAVLTFGTVSAAEFRPGDSPVPSFPDKYPPGTRLNPMITFGWQDRVRVCVALTEEQCTAVVQLQSGGSDGAGGGDAGGAGDAGPGAGSSGGDGCGPK